MAVTHFEMAYSQLSQDKQNILQEKILEWEASYGWKSKRVVENFKDEHFLPIDQMKMLMDFIIARKDKPFDDIKNEMRSLIYNKHQLQGDSIKLKPYPEIVGFAISKGEYKDLIMRLYRKKYFDNDENEVDKFINNLTQEIYEEEYAECLFKDDFKLIWLTWDTTKDIDNPFCFMHYSKAEEVTFTLGLDSRYFKPPLLLFLMNVKKVNDTGFVMFRPTFCDSDFYENFKPTPLDFKDYGLTQPLVDTISEDGNSYNPERRPETVVRSKHVKLNQIEKIVYVNR